MSSDYEEEVDEVTFGDRCKLIETKSIALSALVSAYPLKIKDKKHITTVIEECIADIGDNLALLAVPKKRERDEDDDVEEEDEPDGLISVSDRAWNMGYRDLTHAQKQEAGRRAVQEYMAQNDGEVPPKKNFQNKHGDSVPVSRYTAQECNDFVDRIIKSVARK
jgi:hypothetical protein